MVWTFVLIGLDRPLTEREQSTLEDRLGHCFGRQDLLTQALTHPSLCVKNRGLASYERLEFLGDRVLGVVIAAMLFERFPAESEGDLARRFTSLVRMETLAEVALSLRLDQDILLSRGDEGSGGRDNPSLQADVCEAVIAALYLDGGFDCAESFVRKNWAQLLTRDPAPPQDAKSALQEWAQARALPLPCYRVVERTGAAHAPQFVIEVSVSGFAPVCADGPSKRKAEQCAAALLLDSLRQKSA